MKKEFDAVITLAEGHTNASFVKIPYDVKEAYGKGRVKVKATFDGVEYRGSIVNMGGCYMLGLRNDIRKAINKQIGETVHVIVEEDKEERVVEVPEDVKQVLASVPEAESKFNKMSYSHRKEWINSINEAKKQETRDNRIVKLIQELEKRK